MGTRRIFFCPWMRESVHTNEFQRTELLKEYCAQCRGDEDESDNEDNKEEVSKEEEKEKKIPFVHLLKSFKYIRDALQSQKEVPKQLFHSLNNIKSYLESSVFF